MARKSSEEHNLFDVFNHLWYFTDPVLRKHNEIPPKISTNNEIFSMQSRGISEDDKIFYSLIISDEFEIVN